MRLKIFRSQVKGWLHEYTVGGKVNIVTDERAHLAWLEALNLVFWVSFSVENLACF